MEPDGDDRRRPRWEALQGSVRRRVAARRVAAACRRAHGGGRPQPARARDLLLRWQLASRASSQGPLDEEGRSTAASSRCSSTTGVCLSAARINNRFYGGCK